MGVCAPKTLCLVPVEAFNLTYKHVYTPVACQCGPGCSVAERMHKWHDSRSSLVPPGLPAEVFRCDEYYPWQAEGHSCGKPESQIVCPECFNWQTYLVEEPSVWHVLGDDGGIPMLPRGHG